MMLLFFDATNGELEVANHNSSKGARGQLALSDSIQSFRGHAHIALIKPYSVVELSVLVH